jgi:hypothetical protein
MLSQAQALQSGAGSPGLAEAVAEIEAGIRRGANLTRQLLLFSRREVEQRTVRVLQKPFDMAAFAREVREALKAEG